MSQKRWLSDGLPLVDPLLPNFLDFWSLSFDAVYEISSLYWIICDGLWALVGELWLCSKQTTMTQARLLNRSAQFDQRIGHSLSGKYYKNLSWVLG